MISKEETPKCLTVSKPLSVVNLCEMEIFMWTFVKFMDIRGLKRKGFESERDDK